ncbi:hypothetical protein MMC27_001636 [Xylographa pallens]|nr:hypothetical protein [Xylographa pallens]
MFPASNINMIPSSDTSSLQGEPSSVFDENAAAGALLSFTTPPSSQGSPSHDLWGTSLDSEPATGGFFPAQSGFWDDCTVQNKTGVILDKATMAQKLALVRASKASNESLEMKEAAGLLTVLQKTPAPWSMSLNERVAHHHNSGQGAVNGIDYVDLDGTDHEELPEDESESEDESQEQPVVADQQEAESHTASGPPISAKAAGKQREKYDSPALLNSSHAVSLPAATSRSSASKIPTRRRSGANGSASTRTTARTYEFVNQTLSNIVGHKRKRAPPTPRTSAGSSKSPTNDEASQTSSAKPAESLPTPPLRTMSASTLDIPQQKSAVVKSKLSRTPDVVHDEEQSGKEKQERTSKSGRTIKNTERWTSSGYYHR